MSYKVQALPVPDDPSAESQNTTSPDIKVVSSTPKPVAQPAASDPLAVIKAMSEEEKIALFS